MKILVVPDSFKGSLSSQEVCDCISAGIKSKNKNVEIETIPFADGGEGFSSCLAEICKGEKIVTTAHNIYNQEIEACFYAFGDTTIIEAAQASGLLKERQVMQSSSYGTGELIKHAKGLGFNKIILGLGGTGSSDGGAGALAALGVKFYDENGDTILRPKSSDLSSIFKIDFKSREKDIELTFACDVENEFFGKNGAAHIYAPQKGASQTDVIELDKGLQHLNTFFKNDISKVKGAGAAGGLCGGLYAVYGGSIKSGFDILAEYSRLEEKINQADIIVTGEGKTDKQTLMGKLPFKICELAKKHGKKCVIISGMIEEVSFGDKMISLVDDNTTPQEAIKNAKEVLTEKSKYILQ